MHILVKKTKKIEKKSFSVLFDSFEAKQYPKSLSINLAITHRVQKSPSLIDVYFRPNACT
jgi:hypothetical protein